MRELFAILQQKPSAAVSWITGMGLVIIWGLIRLAIFHDILFPLTYAMPLLICIWTRKKTLLMTMALIFTAMAAMEFYLITPNEALPGNKSLYAMASTMLDIFIIAPTVYFIILLLDCLEGTLDKLRLRNEHIQQQNSEVITLNVELGHREDVLQKMVDSARLVRTEMAVMGDICETAMKMFDEVASAVVVYEIRDSQLMILTQSGLGDNSPESWPVGHTFTELAIRENRTECLRDTALRPNLLVLSVPGHDPFHSILCAPIHIEGQPVGAVTVYGRKPQEWTDHQFRLAEWVAAQCGHILQTLRMQQALRQQAELIDLSPAGILVRRMDGTITFWSNGAEKIYGWTREEAIGQKTSTLLQPFSPKQMEGTHSELSRTGRWSGELVHITRDGREVIVQSYWLAQFDRQGRIKEIFETNMDITDRKRVEDEVRRHRDHLDDLVKERTVELEVKNQKLKEEMADRIQAEEEKKKLEIQLIQTQKMEALGRFAGGIAHDLNNILCPIIINTEILLEDTEPETSTYEKLEQILSAGQRQKDLVKQILSFSRRNEQAYRPIKIVPLLQETIGLLRTFLPSTIEIREHIDISSDTVFGDSTQIQQIIMNLCRNAVDAIGAQKGTLEISLTNTRLEPMRAHQELQAGEYLQLVVRDTGQGIKPEVMDHIFEPFFTTKDIDKGTGMGLAVAHGIIKDHGGTISVESEPGKGSRFVVHLPVTDSKPRPLTPDGGKVRHIKGKVLLIDDDDTVLTSIKNALRRLDYTVVSAKSGQEAIQRFKMESSAFDVVLTDLTMPQMDGLELTARLKEIRSDIHVILCTGLSDAVDGSRIRERGICELIRKPADINELKTAISRCLSYDG